MYVCMYVCMYVNRAFLHTQTKYTCIHTHAHTHIQAAATLKAKKADMAKRIASLETKAQVKADRYVCT